MGDGFGFPILGVLDDLKILPESMYALVVIAVDEHVGTEKRMEKTAGQVVGGVKYIYGLFLMVISV